MAKGGHMHWHEGLFLQPHHLQFMQRDLLAQVAGLRRSLLPYPYGVIRAELSPDELENMRVRFDKLDVVMPSGLRVSVPDNADLAALDIQDVFAKGNRPFDVRLAVPLWYSNRANVAAGDGDWRVKRLYRLAETEVEDENTGENPQPLLVRRINARLLLEDDDPSDLEAVPLIRVAHATGDAVGAPRLDPAFIPPCFLLQGSRVLLEMVRDLANQVEATRGELVVQLARGGFSLETLRGVQFEQLWRLRSLNQYGGILSSLVQAPCVTPFEIYLELRALLGELAALYTARDQYAVPNYDHDSPYLCFRELVTRIRSLLRGAVAPSYLKVEFARDGKFMTAALTDEHLTRPNEYFLGIKTKLDPQAVARLAEDADKFKLMARSMAVVGRAVWGIRLGEERHPPLGFPAEVGLHYFRLHRTESPRRWQQIGQEKAMAIWWEGLEASDFDIALYMPVPETEAKR